MVEDETALEEISLKEGLRQVHVHWFLGHGFLHHPEPTDALDISLRRKQAAPACNSEPSPPTAIQQFNATVRSRLRSSMRQHAARGKHTQQQAAPADHRWPHLPPC